MVANLKLKGIDGGLPVSISRDCTAAAGWSVYTEKMTVNCKRGSASTLAPPPVSGVSLGSETCCVLSDRV